MISRHWKGTCKRDQAEAYVRHMQSETLPALQAIPGFVRASILRRDVPSGIEFQIVTAWQSLDAIRAFAGEDAEAAVVPAAVQAMMVDFERRAVHYEVAASTGE